MQSRRKQFRPYLIVGIVLALIGAYFAYRGRTKPRTAADYSCGILSYAANPHFIASDFLEQLTGTAAKLEVYDFREDPKIPKAYFSIPEEHLDAAIKKIAWQPERVECAPASEGRQRLGNYSLSKPGWRLVRIANTNFRVNPEATLRYAFFDGAAAYTVSAKELLDWIENKSVYGGFVRYITGETRVGVTVIANHGAWVARRGEASLTRLVKNITADLIAPEAIAQRLLDFVTHEIAYDGREASWDHETLKRANEVLMSGKSDCSGLTILYASLLEQTGIDYRLLYLPQHIAVGVVGKFPSDNGQAFRIRDQVLHLAETTTRDFQIGRTLLERDCTSDDVRYLQRPAPDADILNAETGRPLEADTD